VIICQTKTRPFMQTLPGENVHWTLIPATKQSARPEA
jgi:hypothetical protein